MVVLPSIKYTLKHFYKIITKINPKNQILYFQEFPTQCHRLVICDLLCHKKSLQMAKNIMLAIMRPIHIQIQFVHKWIFMRLLLDKKIVYTCMFMFRKQEKVSKVHIFWEGHKIFQNLHHIFVLCSVSQKQRWRLCKILWPSENKWTLIFICKTVKIPNILQDSFIASQNVMLLILSLLN